MDHFPKKDVMQSNVIGVMVGTRTLRETDARFVDLNVTIGDIMLTARSFNIYFI